jgi:N1221-like protein
MTEIEEFYSYIEMPQVAENLKAWEGSFTAGVCCNTLLVSVNNVVVHVEWTKTPLAQRKVHIELLLESLEHRDAEIRFTNARRLFYVLQGIYALAIY